MKSAAGPILRRGGLLIEMICLLLFVTQSDRNPTIAGIAVRPLLIAGVALGFFLWAAGLALLLRDRRRDNLPEP